MAADDDLDALEAQLEDYDDDDDDDDLPPLKLIWKKYKLIIVPATAFIIFIPVILMSIGGGSNSGQPKLVIVPELAPEPGKQIKMTPEQSGAGKVPGKEEGVFSVVTEGKNEGKIVITAPPENPETPPGDGKAADGTKAAITMAPEGAEKTPKDAASANGAMVPPTPPEADAVAGALPPPPAPGETIVTENILPAPAADGKPAADGGKAAENAMPVPAGDGKTADAKQPAKPAEVAVEVPAESATMAEAPANNNQIAVVIPKAQTNMVAPPPPTNAKFTPMRTMAGVYRIQVASARSETGAKTLWEKQVSKHPDVLGQLPLTVQPALIKDRGTFYRVQGGAFGDRESADTVCRKLKSRGQDCIVVRP